MHTHLKVPAQQLDFQSLCRQVQRNLPASRMDLRPSHKNLHLRDCGNYLCLARSLVAALHS